MTKADSTVPGDVLRVLATRPRAQNDGWCQLLRQSGFTCLPIPVLDIEAVQEPRQKQALKNLILEFDRFDQVIFVSQNAVRETLTWLDQYWPQLPDGIQYLAVGQKTAEALTAYGIDAVSCRRAMDSEELLSLPELQDVGGRKILICRGRGGRPHLAEVLEARGARVVFGEFYERCLPSDAIEAMGRSDFLKGRYREIISVFSGESLSNLVEVLEAAPDHWRETPVLVPGERVAQQARTFGFSQVITAINATESAMLEALESWLGSVTVPPEVAPSMNNTRDPDTQGKNHER